MPAESYPRYSMRLRPSRRSPATWRGPIYPTMPHMSLLLLAQETPRSRYQRLRIRPGRRLGDQPEDRLGAAGANVQPPVGPREPQPVALVRLCVTEAGPQRVVEWP